MLVNPFAQPVNPFASLDNRIAGALSVLGPLSDQLVGIPKNLLNGAGGGSTDPLISAYAGGQGQGNSIFDGLQLSSTVQGALVQYQSTQSFLANLDKQMALMQALPQTASVAPTTGATATPNAAAIPGAATTPNAPAVNPAANAQYAQLIANSYDSSSPIGQFYAAQAGVATNPLSSNQQPQQATQPPPPADFSTEGDPAAAASTN